MLPLSSQSACAFLGAVSSCQQQCTFTVGGSALSYWNLQWTSTERRVFASPGAALWIIHVLLLLQWLRSAVASGMFKVSGLAIGYKYILDNVNINFWCTQPWFKKKKKNIQNQTGKRKSTVMSIVTVHWVLLRLNTKCCWNIIVFLPTSKMINLSVPDTIDERAINKKKLTPFIIQV